MPARFSTAQEFLAYLDGLNFFHMDLSLNRMERALDAMGLRRPPFLVVQVAGTNGKGSTATFLASLLQAYGCRAGLFTSPHFVYPSERVMVDGGRVPEEEWLEAADLALNASPDLTYFEIVTCVALACFRARGVRVAVMEAGLGARHDATTATAADMAVFTPMALDHTAVLGPALADIAADKACAIRGPVPAFTAAQDPVAMRVLEERAAAFGAPLRVAAPVPEGTPLGLAGAHQRENAGTALAALRGLLPMLDLQEDPLSTAQGLAHAFIPGRLQTVTADSRPAPGRPPRPACLLDGAHNPHGMGSLVRHLGGIPRPRAVVYSCLRDKDWRQALGMLARALPPTPFLVPAMRNERAEEPQSIIAELARAGQHDARAFDTLSECLAAGRAIPGDGALLVTGSLYLLADFFALYPEALERPPRLSQTPDATRRASHA